MTLPDGTEVVLRPILPQDKAHLVTLLRQMSAESRHLRFHHSKVWLTRRELRYLTEIDYEDHFAWCALIVEQSGTSAIGVARFIRVAPESDRAEVTIEVADHYQGRGLGATLIDILAQTALSRGITSFVAYVEPANRSVIRWAEKAGASFAREHGVLRLELSLIATSPYPRVSQELLRSA